MLKEERKLFFLNQGLTIEESSELANEFSDSADESDLTVVRIFDNLVELGEKCLEDSDELVIHQMLEDDFLEDLGQDALDECDKYICCECTGRIIEFQEM